MRPNRRIAARRHLRRCADRVPDVVFLDLMLPDLDGYAVCRALKASGTTSQVPVMIVTARIAAENRIESFHAGADDYVPKPYTPDQIFEALDQSSEWQTSYRRFRHGRRCRARWPGRW